MSTKRKLRKLKPSWSARRARIMMLAALRVCGNCGAEFPGNVCDVCGHHAIAIRRTA